MNAVGVALVWCVVQVTAVGLVVGGLYFVARWLRPAAAAPLVLAGLVATVVLSLLTLSPWPRWSVVAAMAEPLAAADGWAGEGLPADLADGGHVPGGLAGGARRPGSAVFATRPPSVRPLRHAVVEELVFPSPASSVSGWRWPAVVGAVLLAGMACGLVWLVLGLMAVRSQCRSSRPVDDRPLAELIDVLCAELGCVRPIQVRQSDALVTAAMIGWRRPVLLLPPDWMTWTEDERRAVLAHEIAHARGHDGLAAFCGQLALMLHVYHPLLHWLVGRLRLEQELAADAAAASISGGQRQYLVTIAELALRQQDRPLLWPARTFLPTRNTFLRRIAMLRDSKLSPHRLSPSLRLITVGVVLLAGILVAGLRGPLQRSEARADEKAAGAEPDAGTSAAETVRRFTVQDKVITKDGVRVDGDAWRVKISQNRTVRLFEVSLSGVDNCMLVYRAKLKTEKVEGRAYLEMWCRMPGGGESFSKGLASPVTGTTDWASYETPFFLKAGERPDLVKLNLVVEGPGTVWLKDVELVRGPLPAGAAGPPAAGEPAAPNPAEKGKQAEAQRKALEAAQAWLALIDEGKYAEGWETAAGYLKNVVPRDAFVKSLQGVRTPLGKTVSRRLKSSQYATHLPGAPDGQYVVIQFATSLANAKSAVETVTPMVDQDGQWRVSGYFVK